MLRERNTSNPQGLLERPLSARSLIASLLLRTRPPRMRGSRLVQWCGLFGVAEGTARVALSRMVERGELGTRDGVYELAGRVESRKGAQDWSLEPELAPWRGAWRVAVVAPGPRDGSERAALRACMRRLHYASLREGVWTRPDNLPRASAPVESWQIADAQCIWWTGRPDDDPAELSEALFDSAGWSERAEFLSGRLRIVTRALGSGPDALAEGFVTGAAALAHVRADPLLPRELTADTAAGDALRSAYRAYEAAFSDALRTWFGTAALISST
jgi:phenylacetic acid degradation operon negative regulatory protein